MAAAIVASTPRGILKHTDVCDEILPPKFVSPVNHVNMPSRAEIEDMHKEFIWPRDYYWKYLYEKGEPSEQVQAAKSKDDNSCPPKEESKDISKEIAPSPIKEKVEGNNEITSKEQDDRPSAVEQGPPTSSSDVEVIC